MRQCPTWILDGPRSLAPEILLSVLEVCGHNFTAGDLILAPLWGVPIQHVHHHCACVYVARMGRRGRSSICVCSLWQQHGVIFAYTWLYIILSVSSPVGREVWEGSAHFLLLPHLCQGRLLGWQTGGLLTSMSTRGIGLASRGMIIEHEGDRPSSKTEIEMDESGQFPMLTVSQMSPWFWRLMRDQDDEEARREMARIWRNSSRSIQRRK